MSVIDSSWSASLQTSFQTQFSRTVQPAQRLRDSNGGTAPLEESAAAREFLAKLREVSILDDEGTATGRDRHPRERQRGQERRSAMKQRIDILA